MQEIPLEPRYPFRAFVFEGGGTTAFGTYGALEVFDEHNLIEQAKYLIGSSSGSFLAGALGCGIKIKDVREMLMQTDFNKFLDDSWGIGRDTYRLFTKFGWYKGDYIEEWFGKALSKWAGSSEITFQEAFDKTGIVVVITTTDMTTGEIVYMNKDNTPNLPIKKAVRRSTSLPFIFKPDYATENVELYEDGATRIQQLKRCYVDGGMIDNYPIYYFDTDVEHQEVVGFKLMTTSELSEVTNPYVDPTDPQPPTSLRDMLLRLIILVMNKNFKIHIPQKDWERTIKIDTENHSSIDFDVSTEDREWMIEQGRKAATQYLQDFDRIYN